MNKLVSTTCTAFLVCVWSGIFLLPAPAQAPAHAPAPPTAVASEPQLSANARAVISTWNREEVPKVWPCGVPIGLSSMGSAAGDLPQSIRWAIEPAWVDQWSRRTVDGRQVSVATGIKAKTIKVTLYVAKGDTFDMTSVVIAVRPDPNEPGDGDYTPGPGPEPKPPKPGPEPIPVPLTAFAQQVHDLAIAQIPQIASRKAGVQALAKSHDDVAGQVSQAVAGVPAYASLKEPKAIVDTTVVANRAAVGSDRDAYVPFFTALNELLKPLSKTTLATAGGHIGVWQDIAAGLRAAAP